MSGSPASEPATSFDHGSFRDRTARVLIRDGRVFRALSQPALDDWEALSATGFFPAAVESGRVIRTTRTDEPLDGFLLAGGPPVAVLSHARIPFVSYPYEWSFGMLKDAALLTLDLLLAALDDGFSLKDGTPYNVQWIGCRPVFIDIPSFHRLEPGEPWAGYRQFCELFLYPLLLQAYKGVPFHPWLRGAIDGITPDQCRSLMGLRDYLRPGVLTHVYLQSKLQARYGDTTQDVRATLRSAGFGRELIKANARRLRALVSRLAWSSGATAWSGYAESNRYDDDEAAAKRGFVERAASARRRRLVWDLGSNTGVFSRIAAAHADDVISIDADHAVIERLYMALRREGPANVLPLYVNLADPSPGLGWRGAERQRLEARGRPDLVLALALVHHLVIGSNVPLTDVLDWLASIGGDLVIEFVTRDDPMVQTLLRNRDDHYTDYHLPVFETELMKRFRPVERQAICGGARILFHVQPLSS